MRQGKTGDWEDRGTRLLPCRGCYKYQLFVDLCFRYVTQFNKDAKYLNPITEGLFYAVKEYDMTRGNYGGILTNADFQVITEAGEPIPGLYATGIISSGDYFGDYYPGREALSLCAHGGYIAGNNAAEFAR